MFRIQINPDDYFNKIFEDFPIATEIPLNKDDTGCLYFECEFPGYKKEDVELSIKQLDNNIYSFAINGNKKTGKDTRQYKKTITVKESIDLSTVRATLELGILKVSFKLAVKEKEIPTIIKIE